MKFNIDKMKNVNQIAPKVMGGRLPLRDDEIRIGVSPLKKTLDIDRNAMARIIFGANIIFKLRWEKGDSLTILFDDENLFLKREHGGRYSLQCTKKSKNASWRVGLTLFKGMPFSTTKKGIGSTSVKWEYYQDGIIIKLPTSDET